MATIQNFFKRYWPFALIALAFLYLGLQFIKPAAPKTIVFASGGDGGAYHAYAERYKTLFGAVGVEVEVLTTAGSIENLRLLQNGEADIALLQGGTARADDSENFISLGGLFHEPLWVFARADLGAESFSDLRTTRMAIGGEGSGTRMLVMQMQREFGGEWSDEARLPFPARQQQTLYSQVM